jgi:hypothetical protein
MSFRPVAIQYDARRRRYAQPVVKKARLAKTPPPEPIMEVPTEPKPKPAKAKKRKS